MFEMIKEYIKFTDETKTEPLFNPQYGLGFDRKYYYSFMRTYFSPTMYLLCWILLILASITLIISPISAMENYTEELSYHGFYSTYSGITGWGASTTKPPFSEQFMINFDTMPQGSSTLIIELSTLSYAVEPQVSSDFTMEYNGSTVASGSMMVSNGTFSGQTHQIVLWFDQFTPPVGYTTTGTHNVTLWSTIEAQEGHIMGITDYYEHYGPSSGVACYMRSPAALYVFNYPVNVESTYSFSRSDTNAYFFTIDKKGYLTKATIFSPTTTKAYTETYFNNYNRENQPFVGGGKVVGQVCSALSGGFCMNTSGYYGNNYTLNVRPNTTQLGLSVTSSVFSGTNSLSRITSECWRYLDANDNIHDFISSGYEQVCYTKKGGTWYAYNVSTDDFTISKGSTMPNDVSLRPELMGALKVYLAIFTADDETFVLWNDLNVTSNGALAQVEFFAVDKASNAYVDTPTYSILNKASDTTTVYTSNLPDGSYTTSIPIGSPIQACAVASGYEEGCIDKLIQGNDIINIPLSSTALASTNISNTTLIVNVKFTNDGVEYYPLKDSLVEVETSNPQEPNQYQSDTTNEEGITSFTVVNVTTITSNSNYQVGASAEGYKSAYKSVNPTGSSYDVDLFLVSNTIVTTYPTTFIPEITYTPTPTQTGIGGTPINGTPMICQDANNLTDKTWLGGIKNGVACAGFNDFTSQSLAFACIIILFCVYVGSRFGKGIGSAIGAIIGFVLSLAMNLIAFWVFAALLVLVGLVLLVVIIKNG